MPSHETWFYFGFFIILNAIQLKTVRIPAHYHSNYIQSSRWFYYFSFCSFARNWMIEWAVSIRLNNKWWSLQTSRTHCWWALHRYKDILTDCNTFSFERYKCDVIKEIPTGRFGYSRMWACRCWHYIMLPISFQFAFKPFRNWARVVIIILST